MDLLSTILDILSITSLLDFTSKKLFHLRLYDGNETVYIQSNLTDAEEVIFTSPKFDPNKDTVFTIHGYLATSELEESKVVSRAFLNRGLNVIGVDWREMAYNFQQPYESPNSILHYPEAAKNTKLVGVGLAVLINKLHADNILPIPRVTCIGTSLGAQVCGALGRHLVTKIPVIIGLDPAGPLFGPYQPHQGVSREDGEIVHLVHTDAGLLGTSNFEGTVSFAVNGGRRTQPGCNPFDAGCSHLRCIPYFVEAMERPSAFKAGKCPSSNQISASQCNSEYIFMGYPPNSSATGVYYLQTNNRSPFGRGV